VRFAQRGDGALGIEVPREFCFEPGKTRMKPALAAVLDKVAESLRRMPFAQLPLLAAPDDASGPPPLAMQRASEIRDHLRARGVDASRLGKPSAASAAAVQLRIEGVAP
jgi:outer membrane protein OmpA-like peptidoglycan-associated protein